METLYKTTSEKQEDGTWKEIRTPLSAEEQALREKEELDWKEYVDTVVIPNQYKSDRVNGVYTLNNEGEAIDPNENLVKYPPIGDQLDALYHAGVFPQEMADKLKEVKEKYPKGAN